MLLMVKAAPPVLFKITICELEVEAKPWPENVRLVVDTLAAGCEPGGTWSSTETLLSEILATARSMRPSPLKSADVIPYGKVPVAKSWFSWKVPSPFPNMTETALANALVLARSRMPSPLISATVSMFTPWPAE
jgi:hypothetical protein